MTAARERPLQIIIASPTLELGGVLRTVLDLAEGLHGAGHEVVVALDAAGAEVRAATQRRGLRWVDLDRSARLRADVWHLHLNNTLDTRMLPLLARRRTTPGVRVVTEHLPRTARTDPAIPFDPSLPHGRRKPGARLGKIAFKRAECALADVVVAPSRAASAFLVEAFGLPEETVRTVYNGVPAPPEPPPPPSPDAVMAVLTVGMLAARKGQDVLLEAAARAREPWSLTFVGEGALEAELRAAAARLPEREIRFAGWRDDAAAAPLEAHVACLPSRMESFGYAAVEAMACARPVVATRIDGLSEVVDDGVSGLLVAPEDPAALAAALDALAVDPQRRARMGVAGHARVRREFTVERMVERTLALYFERARPCRANSSDAYSVERFSPV